MYLKISQFKRGLLGFTRVKDEPMAQKQSKTKQRQDKKNPAPELVVTK